MQLLAVLAVLAVLAAMLTAAAEAASCRSNFDCSLSGTCLPSGACRCKSWASGADCARLNLVAPASAATIKPLVQPHGNWTRWGGSPVHDKVGG